MARIRRLSGATPLTPNDRAIAAEAADRLLAGELIILPTDTVYGLFLHSTAPEAIARLERLKHRPQPKPLAVLLREDERLVAFMRGTVEPLAGGAAEKLIPGALTLIAPFAEWRGLLPPELAALPYPAIGVRIPAHPFLQEVLAGCGCWALATSANVADEPTPAALDEVLKTLSVDAVSFAVDGGECPQPPSAVVELSQGKLRVLRSHPLLTSGSGAIWVGRAD